MGTISSGEADKCPINRIMQPPPEDVVGIFSQIAIKTYSMSLRSALKSVNNYNNGLQVSAFDLAWMLGYHVILTPCLPVMPVMKSELKLYHL